MFPAAPFVKELTGGELIGEGMIQKHIVGQQESRRLLEAVKDAFGCVCFFGL